VAKAAASATVTVLMLSTCAIAFDAASETRYQTDSLCPLNMPPRFDHGYLAVYEWSGVGIYAASGALQYRIPKLPNALTMNVAVDKDGTAVTSGDFSDGKGALWLWNSAGSNIRVIRTPDYVPSYVAFAPDGSIWTTGTRDQSNRHTPEDYAILRHFSREGALLGAYLPRSSFPSEREPAEPVMALPALCIANGRIGVYFSGGGRKHHVWIEVDLNGKELGRWLLSNIDGDPAAFTEAGVVYARSLDGIYRLDRAAGNWIVTSIAVLGTLVGSDGESLVFADRASPRIYRVPVTFP
jgi:hypothetical protein